jgi:hypothetical protein
VDDGDVRSRIVPDDTDIIVSEGLSSYTVHVQDGAAVAVCLSVKGPDFIKAVLQKDGRLKVLNIQLASTTSSEN